MALLACLAFFRPVFAQDLPSADTASLITADEIVYDEVLGLVTARGNVEISQGERVLVADVVNYNTNTGVVTASGNVTLVEPGGEVVSAEFVEVDDDLRDGFIRDIRVLLTDQSRIAAASGRRSGGNLTVFRKALFSPCRLCREDPERAPLWQLRADRVEHDQEDQTLRYYDASLEIFGVPIAYTPYFEHPDPTVERKSGFLAPTFGGAETLGLTLQVPYFWEIDDTSDATFEPIFTTKQSIVGAGQYRKLFTRGAFEFNGSGTIADREKGNGGQDTNAFRGHVDSFSRYDINDRWRAGSDIKAASDKTYLRLYNFSNESTLRSRAYGEYFEGRNYGAANAFVYQGQRDEDNWDQTPIVAPLVEYDFVSEPDSRGGTYRLDTSFLTLTRISGRDMRRASTVGSYEVPFVGPLGDLYKATARLQADGYYTTGVDPGSNAVDPDNDIGDDVEGRVFPQLALQWRYPFIQRNDSFDQVVEPIVQFVAGPGDHNPDSIPNEDSLGFEFDDTNLFNLDRFPGNDRVESGNRVDYGLQWSAFDNDAGAVDVFLGQSYRFTGNNDKFNEGSGLDDHLSDVVGRIDLTPVPEVDIVHLFQVDKDDLSLRRNSISAKLGPPALNLNVGYLFITGDASAEEFGDREELTTQIGSRLNDNWSVFFSQRRDLRDDRQLSLKGGFAYEDECFRVEAVASREKFRDRDIEPENSFFVRVTFKYLGEVKAGT